MNKLPWYKKLFSQCALSCESVKPEPEEIYDNEQLIQHVKDTMYWEVEWQKGTFDVPLIVRTICTWNSHRHIVEQKIYQGAIFDESVDYMVSCITNKETENDSEVAQEKTRLS